MNMKVKIWQLSMGGLGGFQYHLYRELMVAAEHWWLEPVALGFVTASLIFLHMHCTIQVYVQLLAVQVTLCRYLFCPTSISPLS